MKKLVATFIIIAIGLPTLAANIVYDRETNAPVVLQRGYKPKQIQAKQSQPKQKSKQKTSTKQSLSRNTQSPKKVSSNCRPCQQPRVYTIQYCSKNKPCTRTGFARPERRYAQPNKGFARPNKRFAQPRVRCNNVAKNSHYYKSGMSKRYPSHNSRYTSTQTSRLSKNYTTKQAPKVSCGGITYYSKNNPCK